MSAIFILTSLFSYVAPLSCLDQIIYKTEVLEVSDTGEKIQFVGKANEKFEGKYVFYNTEPNIGLSGLVPQRYHNPRLSDNLLIRLLPHCACSRCKFYCGCCSQMQLDALNIDTMVCVKVEYLEKDIGFSYSLTVNDAVYTRNEVSVRNPPPVCFMIPTPLPRLKSGACIHIFDVEVDGDEKTIHGCVKFSVTIMNMFSSNYDLGCFHVNVNKNQQPDNYTNDIENYNGFIIDKIVLQEELKTYKVNKEIFSTNPFLSTNTNKENREFGFTTDVSFVSTNSQSSERNLNKTTATEALTTVKNITSEMFKNVSGNITNSENINVTKSYIALSVPPNSTNVNATRTQIDENEVIATVQNISPF